MTTPPLPTVPEQNETGLVPFNPDNNLPVVTDASRQYKLLRSMAREVRGIRESLSEIGLPQVNLPELESLDQIVETADFARLAMAVEDHRSLLRKVPLKPPMLYFYISSNYGMRRHPVLKTKRFHHGIDLAGTWQETVHAPAPGTVIYAGRKGSFGKVVQVRHAYGLVTTYAHLAKITVRKGADVVPGTVVGKMGRTGRVDGAHLHYEIRLGDKSIDPKKFFALGHRIGVGGELMLAADGQ
jgi:murein DD-endopeptidase MepM/ murein hydrolase activator NlpD